MGSPLFPSTCWLRCKLGTLGAPSAVHLLVELQLHPAMCATCDR